VQVAAHSVLFIILCSNPNYKLLAAKKEVSANLQFMVGAPCLKSASRHPPSLPPPPPHIWSAYDSRTSVKKHALNVPTPCRSLDSVLYWICVLQKNSISFASALSWTRVPGCMLVQIVTVEIATLGCTCANLIALKNIRNVCVVVELF
jgi:hypothetical protein